MNDAALRERDFRRILLIKPSSPGDIIHALPVLYGLRRRYPNAHVAWLVASPFINLIEREPALSEVISFDRRRFGRVGRSLSVTGEFAGFVQSLRDRAFDLVLDLQGLFRSGFLAMASGAPVRIGFADAREFAWMFYTHAIAVDSLDRHAADRNFGVASLLGFSDAPLTFGIAVSDADRATAQRLLDECSIGPDDGYAVLVPGTRWETKCWPPDRFGLLAIELKQRHGLPSVLVGGASDVNLGGMAAVVSQGAAHHLCGRTSLRELAALIERAAIVVTADSTPMHLAAALDRPLVALFGPTNPARTGPYGRSADVLRIDLKCSPCYLKKLSQCRFDHACMQQLEVEHVADAVGMRLDTLKRDATVNVPALERT